MPNVQFYDLQKHHLVLEAFGSGPACNRAMNRLGIRYMDAQIQLHKDKDHRGHNIIHNAGSDTAFQIQIFLALKYMNPQLAERFRQGYSLVEGDDALPWLPYTWSGCHIDQVNVLQDLSLAPKTKRFLERVRTEAQHNDNEVDQVPYETPKRSTGQR